MQLTLPDQTKTVLPSLGFLGLGWIGRNRMEAIIRENCASVGCIAEPVASHAKQALEMAPSAFLAEGLDALIHNPNLQGIVIATPSAQHAAQAIKALEAGKAVFCQKPLGRTEGEVSAVVETAKRTNLLLGVDLSYRYTHAVQELYALIQQGELGEIFAANLIFHNAYGPDKPWFYDITQSGGGCVMDLGIHLVDLALWCLDFPEITSVKSSLYHKGMRLTSFEEHVEDYGVACLETEPGASINLQCSWNLSAGRDAIIEARFYGTRGGAAFRNINGSFYDFVAEKYEGTKTTLLSSHPDEWSGRAGVVWSKRLATGMRFDSVAAAEYLKTAAIIDRIYGR